MNQPLLGNPCEGILSNYSESNQMMSPAEPLLIENLDEFYLGPRENLKVQITQQGVLERGILDFGIVTGPQGV